MEKQQDFYGRRLPKERVPETFWDQADLIPAFRQLGHCDVCIRCGQAVPRENLLPTGNYYCRFCLVFGRLTSESQLCSFPQKLFPATKCLRWSGQLTPFQKEVSDALVNGLIKKENLLVHAVTGAGKTEMIYQVMARVIDKGGAVCVASPRVDVCIELDKRFRRDFSCSISLLHGESENYRRSPLVVATTHQLMTFYRAFDLLIIDEVDAFPFVDNACLYHAVEQATKSDGINIYLTATSTDALEKLVKKGKLKKHHLARRFHANPLVVPKTIWQENSWKSLAKQQLPRPLYHYLKRQRKTEYPLLIFYPNIKEGKQFAECLQGYFPEEKVGFVSSKTVNRLELVDAFRTQEITILVSTTILERGVTFPCVDVFVIEAHHRIYTRSALVQIAGRVGRSKERPTGELLFFHTGLTTAIKQSIAEIKEMNHKGGF
ncbi:DEAD/DEAH box helicase [Streptococcus sciuri]|uniref:DEAD/DEAH box helicase n=1 Tax=Streptococcus sciuri TaxID=2973939 RepID=A0ABT2F844_9STRE|nr:DEAD/DEAH box helicase [Streptococcus sciuri]MCS4488584.1 DEAD/DEAH box helicase [Streptococcus sciuri]